MGSPYFSSWLKPKGVSDEEYRKKLEEEDEKRRELERQLKLAKEIEKKQKQNQLETQIKENQPKINEIERSINRLRIQYRDGIIEKYNAFIDELCILMSNNTNVWAYLFGHQIELQEHFSSFYKNEYIHIKQTRLKESIITENIVGGRHIPVRHIPVYVQYMHSSKGYDIDRLYKKTGKQSKHLTQARRWATYIKPIVKEQREREEQVRKEEEGKRLEQYRFNIRNKHKNDSKISFREEDHIYVVDGTPLDSVTSFVKNCFPEFNADYHAKRKAEAMGITKEEVLKMWDKKGRESREQGTKMHKKIEAYYLGKTVSTDETFDLFKIFANKITLKPYRTEWAVYDWEQKIAGTIDFVDYQNGEYIIYDWKRSDKLIAKNGLPIKSNQYGEKALAPIDNLDDSPYYHYALQLSLYKYILEKDYGIIVSKLRLGIFHPSYNKPYVLEMPYLKNEIDTLFNLKSEVIF